MAIPNKRKEFESMTTATLSLYVMMDRDLPKRELWEIYEVVSDRLAALESSTKSKEIDSQLDMEITQMKELQKEITTRMK